MNMIKIRENHFNRENNSTGTKELTGRDQSSFVDTIASSISFCEERAS